MARFGNGAMRVQATERHTFASHSEMLIACLASRDLIINLLFINAPIYLRNQVLSP